MSNTDSFIKDVFSVSSIALAVLIIVSSIAIISRTPAAQGTIINDDGIIESVIPVPAIMIDQVPVLQENADIRAQLGDDIVMVHFVEFPPMHINAHIPLNN